MTVKIGMTCIMMIGLVKTVCEITMDSTLCEDYVVRVFCNDSYKTIEIITFIVNLSALFVRPPPHTSVIL